MSRTNLLIVIISLFSAFGGYLLARSYYSPQSLTERHIGEVAATVLPAIDFPSLTGSRINNDSLKGKPTLINFWATWCAPCREEMPGLIAAQDELGQAASIVGLAIDDLEAVQAFADELGVNYPVAIVDLLAGNQLATQFGNQRLLLPFSVFVAPDGRIDEVRLGEVEKEEVIARLVALADS